MAKEVKNKVSLDATRFERGVSKVKRGVKDMEKGLTIDFQKAVKAGAMGVAALAAGITAAGVAIGAGVNKVVQMGAELDQLSTQTGIAVSSLMVMRQAFEDSGVSADKVQSSVGKMQRMIGEAAQGNTKYTETLNGLGLSLSDLEAMSPDEQFAAIGDAIGAVENPAMRATAAMQVFGKSGTELISVFEKGGMADAAKTIGSQAALMEKNSVLFERVSTLMDRAGKKLGGFFVGIADQVVPVILPLLEQLDTLDLAGKGVQFGEKLALGLRAVIGLMKNGDIGEFFKLSLQEAGGSLLNMLARGWVGIALGFWETFKTGWGIIVDVMSGGFQAIAFGFASIILEAIADGLDFVPGMSGEGHKMKKLAFGLEDKAGEQFQRAANAMQGIPGKLADAFVEGASKAADLEIIDTGKLAEARKEIIDAALLAVPAVGEKAAELIKQGMEKSSFNMPDSDGFDLGGTSGPTPLTGGVSSLAAIGGGGGVGGAVSGVESLVDESRKQSGFLREIRDGIGTLKSGFDNSSPSQFRLS